MSFSWATAAARLRELVAAEAAKPAGSQHLDEGQRASLRWIAQRIQESGVVLADEVGTGKTRIACALVHAVLDAGGRAAVVVPRSLMHQWARESRALRPDGPEPRRLTTLVEHFHEPPPLKDTWASRSPRPDQPEWWLISHGFRAPLVRRNVWRAALPALVALELATRAEREDGRTRLGKLERKLEHALESRSVSGRRWNAMARIAAEVAPRVRRRRDLRRRIEALPPLNVTSWNNDALLEAFGPQGDGRPVTEELLGLWLGELDLLVIDEAHKGRTEASTEASTEANADDTPHGPGPVKGSVLARLVDVILKQPDHGRRLCLTATPMELEPSQWAHLLARARAAGLDREHGEQVAQRLRETIESAAMAPDEGRRLDALCKAARSFSRALSPFVTRRRRDDEPFLVRFRERAGLPADRPHPHRNLQQVPIAWTQAAGTSAAWRDVLFAAECMSHSARGLSLADTKHWPQAVRDAYTKLAAGHVSLDLSDTSEPLRVPEHDAVSAHTRDKIARVAYWYRELRKSHRDVVASVDPISDLDPDTEHPRIVAAVREIERWTASCEKVLVFGVFLQPLRHLRDVLEVRHALRVADASSPLAHAIHDAPKLCGIAVQQLRRLRDEGALTGRLAAADLTEMAMRHALQDSHRAYQRLRPRIRKHIQKPFQTWRNDPALLGRALVDPELETVLKERLVSFVLDDLLASPSPAEQPVRERVHALAEEFLGKYLHPLLGDDGDEDTEDEQQQAERRQTALQRALQDDQEGRQNLRHAQLLEGSTGWATRQYLQAAFNQRKASPRVLIAQSQVGREGIDLHRSCRVVVQFHAEWNPAVLEQQIGRVDRKGSYWEKLAQDWLEENTDDPPPFVEVRQLVFEDTYDAYQWDRVRRRQQVFDASLFGSLLSADAWERVPDDRRAELRDAAPSFRPPGLKPNSE